MFTSASTPTYDRSTSEDVTDWMAECPSGCSLSAANIEQMVAVQHEVVAGSARFSPDSDPNTAQFWVTLRDGSSILGTVTVKTLIEDTRLTAYSDIKLLTRGVPVRIGRVVHR